MCALLDLCCFLILVELWQLQPSINFNFTKIQNIRQHTLFIINNYLGESFNTQIIDLIHIDILIADHSSLLRTSQVPDHQEWFDDNIMIMIMMIMIMMMMTCLLLLMPLSRESEEEAVGREGSELSREELVSILNRILYCFTVFT